MKVDVLQIHFGLTFTEHELECLASIAEMTVEGSGLTFGDWISTNDQYTGDLESAERKLDEELKRVKKENADGVPR